MYSNIMSTTSVDRLLVASVVAGIAARLCPATMVRVLSAHCILTQHLVHDMSSLYPLINFFCL